uniref:Uncharacterized protein n=1 Tax=Cyprinus carpio carpio TaxID=630221 RepID=A0A8C0YHG3_CYPCA
CHFLSPKCSTQITSPFCPAVSCRLRLTMAPKCIGGCAALFVLGVAFDITGFALLSVGIFANLRLNDRSYGDFLIYIGSLNGNIKIFSEDLEKRTFDNWARKLSERLSKSAKPRRAAERENRGAADPEELGDSGERVL